MDWEFASILLVAIVAPILGVFLGVKFALWFTDWVLKKGWYKP